MKEKKIIMGKCEECKRTIEIKRKWQLFCGNQCRFKNWARKHPRILNEEESTI